MSWTNKDGLKVNYGLDQADGWNYGLTSGSQKTLQFDFDPVNKALPVAADVDQSHPSIPAGAFVTGAYLIVTEAWTATGAATLDIGFCDVDGNVIDLDGVDAVIAKAALAADLGIVCDGVLVDGTESVGSDDAYIYTTTTTGPYTAGKARLIIEYYEV